MSNPSPAKRRLPSGLSPLLVWAFLVVVAWATTRSVYSPPDAVALALLYALLAVALVQGARALAALGFAGRLGGAACAGLLLAWHWREQTRIPGVGATLWTVEGVLAFLPVLAVLTGAFLLLELLRGREQRGRFTVHVITWALASVLFLVVLLGVYRGTGTARWHLIRHNHMIGTLAFHLFGTPVAAIEAEQWAAHRRGAPVGQPAWVHELYQIAQGAADSGAPAAEGDREATTPPLPAGGGPGDEQPPDIVVVLLDTLRADGLAAYGGDPSLMPQLNGLATGATVFTDVLANAPWTQPSIASLFTGVLPEEHGVISYPYRMSSNVLTLAEVLQARGYTTAGLVANGVIMNPDSGFARGFDSFEFVRDSHDPRLTYARADTVTDVAATWLARHYGVTPQPADALPAGGVQDGPSPQQEVASRPPLFLYVHYFDPHVPYLSSGLADTRQSGLSFDSARRYYHDELRFLDGELARLADTLAATLDRPRALLIVSDHGEEFGEHGGMGHSQSLYTEVLHVPAVLQLVDAGADAPPAMIDAPLEGRDFFDLLLRLGTGEQVDVADWATGNARPARVASLYFEKDPGRSQWVHYLLRPYRSHIYSRMIQRDAMRYIYSAFGPTDELYDLDADPDELVNLAAGKRGRVLELQAELDLTPQYWARLVPLNLSPEALQNLRQLGYIH
ncbi:MAG: sulfatase [Acidobacteriota bacterium]|jgi:arylsulfatase A-like enzyme